MSDEPTATPKPARRRQAAAPAPPPAPARSGTQCFVHGCPLPGVYRLSNDSAICCVHDGEDAHRWPEQTTRIRRYQHLFDAATRMLNAPSGTPVPPPIVERLAEFGIPDPATPSIAGRVGRITARSYGAQVYGHLIAHCRGRRPAPEDLSSAASIEAMDTETWNAVSTLLP